MNLEEIVDKIENFFFNLKRKNAYVADTKNFQKIWKNCNCQLKNKI